MANYKISDTTLTSIGDAIRRKVGETRIEQVPVENPFNFSFNTEDYDLNEFPNMSATMKIITISITVPTTAKSFKFVYNSSKKNMNNPDLKRLSSDGSLVDARTLHVTSSEYSVEMNLNEGEYLVFEQTFGTGSIELSRYQIDGMFYLYDKSKNLITYDNVEIRNVYTPQQMAQTIDDIPPAPAEEDLTLTGTCQYRFANNGWNWFIEKYGDKIKTKNITDGTSMFYYTTNIKKIPFEINFDTSLQSMPMGRMFQYCNSLEEVPKINGVIVSDMEHLFNSCYKLREVPEGFADWFDWSYIDNLTATYSGKMSNIFAYCYSLRSIPMDFLNHGNPVGAYSNSIYPSLCRGCYALDEIVNIPFPHYNAAWTSNAFSGTFDDTLRLKELTFALQEDGSPYIMNWTKQTIDLSYRVGYLENTYYLSYLLNYNSGITADKQVKDDETYQALKDNPDWFTQKVEYSRYNHDSAVNTINSLPDTSAYLATAGGTNTIKFKGAAGSLTDGGAINTLTAEEIAVAAAKGWTVSLV